PDGVSSFAIVIDVRDRHQARRGAAAEARGMEGGTWAEEEDHTRPGCCAGRMRRSWLHRDIGDTWTFIRQLGCSPAYRGGHVLWTLMITRRLHRYPGPRHQHPEARCRVK